MWWSAAADSVAVDGGDRKVLAAVVVVMVGPSLFSRVVGLLLGGHRRCWVGGRRHGCW